MAMAKSKAMAMTMAMALAMARDGRTDGRTAGRSYLFSEMRNPGLLRAWLGKSGQVGGYRQS